MLGALMCAAHRWPFGKVDMAPEVCSPTTSTGMGSLHLPGFWGTEWQYRFLIFHTCKCSAF